MDRLNPWAKKVPAINFFAQMTLPIDTRGLFNWL